MKLKILAATAALVLAACGPAENNENSQTNSSTNSATNGSTNGMMGGSVSFADDIVPIVATNCAVAGCHADAGNKNFGVDAPADATNVQAAWDGIESTVDGVPLIDPGEPTNSEVFLRVSGMARTQMPLGGALTQAEVDLIEDWIAEGASFE